MGVAVVALAVVSVATPAWADRVDLMSSDGPMRLEISRNGEVDGAYPDKNGVLRGRARADGDIHGTWTQPRSDHPCREARGGTYAWGSFSISGVYSRQPVGLWGYCGEQPDRDWRLRR
jgi:hypothetical protein